jgi:RimJ/RimL family protein N-acetyltransferase
MAAGTLQIRQAVAGDAEGLIDHVIRITNEPHNNVTRDPGQWTMTVEEEREFIAKAAGNPDAFFVVATLDGQIVGSARIDRAARLTARHVASLGISVDAAYRRRGVGMALMRAMIDWARAQGLRRVELKVFTRNAAAIGLYVKLGFIMEGLHRKAFLKQGVWVDEYTMALFLEPVADGS